MEKETEEVNKILSEYSVENILALMAEMDKIDTNRRYIDKWKDVLM